MLQTFMCTVLIFRITSLNCKFLMPAVDILNLILQWGNSDAASGDQYCRNFASYSNLSL